MIDSEKFEQQQKRKETTVMEQQELKVAVYFSMLLAASANSQRLMDIVLSPFEEKPISHLYLQVVYTWHKNFT